MQEKNVKIWHKKRGNFLFPLFLLDNFNLTNSILLDQIYLYGTPCEHFDKDLP